MTVWGDRFKWLKAQGLTRKQLVAVHRIINECRGFGSYTISDSARREINNLYKRGDQP